MDLEHWIIIYLSVAVIFMAVFIWLTVRVINRRERWANRSLAAMTSMPILILPTVAIAAFCVWLTVRIVNRR